MPFFILEHDFQECKDIKYFSFYKFGVFRFTDLECFALLLFGQGFALFGLSRQVKPVNIDGARQSLAPTKARQASDVSLRST
jgi:hypothetical protein